MALIKKNGNSVEVILTGGDVLNLPIPPKDQNARRMADMIMYAAWVALWRHGRKVAEGLVQPITRSVQVVNGDFHVVFGPSERPPWE